MSGIAQAVKEWLMRQPVEPSVMAPIPSRARLAADTADMREARKEILQILGALPTPLSAPLQVAGELAGESEITPWGVAKAAASGIMPVRAGPSKINMMGEASKVDPDVLKRIAKAIKGGVPAATAYHRENALPMIRPGQSLGKIADDAWIPVMGRNPAFSERFQEKWDALQEDPAWLGKDQPFQKIKTTYGQIYAPYELETLAKHYPEVLKKNVIVQRNDFHGSGEAPLDAPTKVNSFYSEGMNGLKGILAHEGTHDIAWKYDLPQGYSPKAVKADMDELRSRAVSELLSPRATPSDKSALLLGLHYPEQVQAGLGKIAGAQGQPSEYAEDLVRALAWRHRLQMLTDPSFNLYRAYHGEQAASGAARYAGTGQYPVFTTPLSKQVFIQGELENPDYALRLQKLYELKKAGLFDPLAQPYEWPNALSRP